MVNCLSFFDMVYLTREKYLKTKKDPKRKCGYILLFLSLCAICTKAFDGVSLSDTK